MPSLVVACPLDGKGVVGKLKRLFGLPLEPKRQEFLSSERNNLAEAQVRSGH
jgi:hypothetical protein